MEKVFKIVLLGDARSGKSSLRTHFLYSTFSQSYTRTSTPDFIATYISLDSALTAVQLWDTDGSARDLTVTTSLSMDADGIALVYDASSASSLYALERHAALVNRVISSQSRPVPVLLIQNKSDCTAEVGEEEAKELVRMYLGDQDVAWIDVSAKTGKNVALAFRMLTKMCYDAWYSRSMPQMNLVEPRHSRHGDPIKIHSFDVEDDWENERQRKRRISAGCMFRRLLCMT